MIVARFWARTSPDGDCILFDGSLTNGWGRFRANDFPDCAGNRVLAHRYSWSLVHGPIPLGHDIHHDHDLCSHRNCVRPAHLAAIDHRDHGTVSTAEQWPAVDYLEPF